MGSFWLSPSLLQAKASSLAVRRLRRDLESLQRSAVFVAANSIKSREVAMVLFVYPNKLKPGKEKTTHGDGVGKAVSKRTWSVTLSTMRMRSADLFQNLILWDIGTSVCLILWLDDFRICKSFA